MKGRWLATPWLATLWLAMGGVVLAGVMLLAADDPVFKTGVDVVALNVVVTDAQKKLVTGLTVGNFAVFEDGVQQDLSFFAADHVPLDLALLLDTSASMSDKIKTLQEAAVGFASSLRDGDRVSIVDIKDNVKVLHPLDGDVGGAKAAIEGTSPRGGTALYNGLYLTLKDLSKQRKANDDVRRQAIAIFSDGDDTASLMTFDDVMELAKQSGVAIYTITLKSASDIDRKSTRLNSSHVSESRMPSSA